MRGHLKHLCAGKTCMYPVGIPRHDTNTSPYPLQSCGNGKVATGAGRGCCWEPLVTTLHVGGDGHPPYIGADTVPVSSYCDRAALFRDGTALPIWGRGDQRIPKQSLPQDSLVGDHTYLAIHLNGRKDKKKQSKPLILGAWDVRTMLDRGDRPMCHTALIARMLGCYQINIAALTETRIAGET